MKQQVQNTKSISTLLNIMFSKVPSFKQINLPVKVVLFILTAALFLNFVMRNSVKSHPLKGDVASENARLTPLTKEVLKKSVVPDSSIPLHSNSSEKFPWENLPPMTVNDWKDFEFAEDQINSYLQWGKISQTELPEFRRLLFKYGERAIADIGKQLWYLKKQDIQNKEDATKIVKKIDYLGYFSDGQMPLAQSLIAKLATREIIWDSNGKPVDALAANITFESFDLYSKFAPTLALNFIKSIEPSKRVGYVTHYAYGRKLAGKTIEEIDQDLRNEFGNPELAYNLNSKEE